MNDRQKIIVDEIKKWQENNLLPDTYCDFLLRLYTEGEEGAAEVTEEASGNRFKTFFSRLLFITAFIFTVIFIIAFTQFSPVLQTSVLGAFLVLSIAGAIYFNYRRSPYTHLYAGMAAFTSFILTIFSADLIAHGNSTILGTGIILLCCVWIVIGWRFRYHYLYIAGGTGILLFIGLLIYDRI